MVLNLDRVAALVDDADAGPWHLAGVEHAAEAWDSSVRGRRRGRGRRIRRTARRTGRRPRAAGRGTGLTGQRRLYDGLDQTALGQVVGGRDEAVARDRRDEDLREEPFTFEVDLRRDAAR